MAATIQNSAAPVFTGEFRHSLEGKNRVTIPAKWRFEEEVELFLIKRSLKKCILVMTLRELERLKATANDKDPEERAIFLDLLGKNISQVTLDKGGRLTIPKALCSELNLDSEVWLSGGVDTFNIWNVADFEQEKAADETARQSVLRRLGI